MATQTTVFPQSTQGGQFAAPRYGQFGAPRLVNFKRHSMVSLSVEEVFDKLTFLATVVGAVDAAAIQKYLLATVA